MKVRFSDFLVSLRKGCGRSREEMRLALGLSLYQYVRYERGKSEPSLGMFMRMMTVMGYDVRVSSGGIDILTMEEFSNE